MSVAVIAFQIVVCVPKLDAIASEHGWSSWTFLVCTATLIVSVVVLTIVMWIVWRRIHIVISDEGVRQSSASPSKYLIRWADVIQVNDAVPSRPGQVIELLSNDAKWHLTLDTYEDDDTLRERIFSAVPSSAVVANSLQKFMPSSTE